MDPSLPANVRLIERNSGLPVRRRLYHAKPPWVEDDACYFLTVCCSERGENVLNNPVVFSVMTTAIEHYISSERWWLNVFVAMPDHWHALISFPGQEEMVNVVKDWKRFVAKRTGVKWQDGFFEHRLRSQESREEKWAYIVQNPVRKGLCARPEDWRWRWVPGSAETAD